MGGGQGDPDPLIIPNYSNKKLTTGGQPGTCSKKLIWEIRYKNQDLKDGGSRSRGGRAPPVPTLYDPDCCTPGSINSLFSDMFRECWRGILGGVRDYLGEVLGGF